MRVALLISGRLKCYDTRLIPLLSQSSYNVDLFASVNDQDGEYYDTARNKLSPWLRGLSIEPFSFCERFNKTFITRSPEGHMPFGQMSCFYNDRKSFELATQYADENGFEYDAYLKYRSDIITGSLPEISIGTDTEIFSVIPWNNHTAPVVTRDPIGYGELVPWVSDAIVYGNREAMNKYTETYDFCLEMIELFSGDYPCNFEPSVTQNAHDKKLKINYFNSPYSLDPSRH